MRNSHPAGAAFLAALADRPGADHSPLDLCIACVRVLAADRAAIMLVSDVGPLEPFAASDDVAAEVDGLQLTLGEGPAVRALDVGAPVLVPDLAVLDDRWPVLAASLAGRVSGAIYAFPLHLGAIRLGVLDLSRREPGQLEPTELAAALAVADTLTSLILASFAATGLDESRSPTLAHSPSGRTINQATGMAMAQLGVGPREAYVRLQARAFAEGRLLSAIAYDVVARRMRLSRDDT